MTNGGSIVLNGSVNAHVGMPGSSVYAASKAALLSLRRTLSAELISQGIRVNVVSPGPVATPLYARLGLPEVELGEMAAGIQSQVALGRFAEPDEIAKSVLHLASDDSSFIIGSELIVDGGMTTLWVGNPRTGPNERSSRAQRVEVQQKRSFPGAKEEPAEQGSRCAGGGTCAVVASGLAIRLGDVARSWLGASRPFDLGHPAGTERVLEQLAQRHAEAAGGHPPGEGHLDEAAAVELGVQAGARHQAPRPPPPAADVVTRYLGLRLP